MYRRNVFQWVRIKILDEATLIMLQCAKTSDSHLYSDKILASLTKIDSGGL